MTNGIMLRKAPDVRSERTYRKLRPSAVFEVSTEEESIDGRRYLKLANGRGWAFDNAALDPGNPSVELLSGAEARAAASAKDRGGGEEVVPEIPEKAPPVYAGEGLKLVGFFNEWKTAGTKTEFSEVPAATRHCRKQISARLNDGRLSFHVISGKHRFALRLFPGSVGADGFSRLAEDDPSAVLAIWGGKDDGEGENFFIEESPGTVVTIFVELLEGAGPATSAIAPPEVLSSGDGAGGTDRVAAVWYVVEEKESQASLKQVVVVDQAWAEQMPRFIKHLPGGAELEILTDVDFKASFLDVGFQARVLSRRTFTAPFVVNDCKDDKESDKNHLTLLVTAERRRVLAFILYHVRKDMIANERMLWIEQVAVLEPLRKRGLGKALLAWAALRAEAKACDVLKADPILSAQRYYSDLGFVETHHVSTSHNTCKVMPLNSPERAVFPRDPMSCIFGLDDLSTLLEFWDSFATTYVGSAKKLVASWAAHSAKLGLRVPQKSQQSTMTSSPESKSNDDLD